MKKLTLLIGILLFTVYVFAAYSRVLSFDALGLQNAVSNKTTTLPSILWTVF